MKPIALREICQVLGARSLTPPPSAESPMIRAVCTDSRQMRSSSLFIALRGERFDGHDFLETVAGMGAVAALIDRPPHPPGLPPTMMHLLLVDDSRRAMGQLARFVRQQFGGKVIAVAGSNGKTGTKHLIHSALGGELASKKLSGSMSPLSFNNDIGVPLAIFPADPQHHYLVLEMGTNHPGEISVLSKIGLPDIGVITNCSAEHLEGLGDIDGVRRENASLIDGMNADGVLILNGDDERLLDAAAGYKGRRITFGMSTKNDLFASDIQCDANGTRFSFSGQKERAFVPMLGRHNAVNSLAAIAVGREMGLSDDEILANLATASGPRMRMELQSDDNIGVRVLNDAYNANPASMKAAIETLATLPTAGRRIAVIGDMRELGPTSLELHREIGRLLGGELAPDLLICVGTMSKSIADEAVAAGLKANCVQHFADARAAADAMAGNVLNGDLVLVKASRAIGLDAVARAILSRSVKAA